MSGLQPGAGNGGTARAGANQTFLAVVVPLDVVLRASAIALRARLLERFGYQVQPGISSSPGNYGRRGMFLPQP